MSLFKSLHDGISGKSVRVSIDTLVWKALGPAAKAAVNREVNLTQEGALGAFGEYFSPSTLAAAFGGLFPPRELAR